MTQPIVVQWDSYLSTSTYYRKMQDFPQNARRLTVTIRVQYGHSYDASVLVGLSLEDANELYFLLSDSSNPDQVQRLATPLRMLGA